MQIWIGTYQLAQEGRGGVSSFTSRPRRNIEIKEGVRRSTIRAVPRDNLKRLYSFSVSRQHESPGDAEVFVLDHESQVPASGVLRLVARNTDGQETERFIEAAVIEVCDSSYIGSSTIHSYSIIGGEMSNTNPAHHAN